MNLAKIMIPKVCTLFLHEDSTVRQAMEIMKNHGFTALPVLNAEDVYIGSISEGDFLRHLLATGSLDPRDHERTRLSALVRRDFCPPLSIDSDEETVISYILKQNFVPIVDGRGALCGILTRSAVIAHLSERI